MKILIPIISLIDGQQVDIEKSIKQTILYFSQKSNCQVDVLLIKQPAVNVYDTLSEYFAIISTIYFINTECGFMNGEYFSKLIIQFLKENEDEYDAVCFLNDHTGNELATRCHVKKPLSDLALEVKSVGFDQETMYFTKIIYGNNLLLKKTLPRNLFFITLDSNMNFKSHSLIQPPIESVVKEITCPFVPSESIVTVLDSIANPEILDITKAKKVIVVGRGVTDLKTLEQVVRFAKIIGAEVGATRAITDLGWVDKRNMIGISGKKLTAEWCLILGASGMQAFTNGIEDCRKIISVNTDSNAPIFTFSDYGIVGDCAEIISQIMTKLEVDKNDNTDT